MSEIDAEPLSQDVLPHTLVGSFALETRENLMILLLLFLRWQSKIDLTPSHSLKKSLVSFSSFPSFFLG